MTHTATPLLHSAQLVHITPKAEELISYMARVSNPSNQSNTETSAKLIRCLIKHKHFSPFEMVNMCVVATFISDSDMVKKIAIA